MEEELPICHFIRTIRNSNDLDGAADNSSDIVLCSMMLIDYENLEDTVWEAARMLKQRYRLYASNLYSCFTSEKETGIGRQGIRMERQVVVKNYLEPCIWEAPLYKGEIPARRQYRTIENDARTFFELG